MMSLFVLYKQGIDAIFGGFKRNGEKPALIISMQQNYFQCWLARFAVV